MAKNSLENELRNLKKVHLTGGELAAYCDQELGPVHRARVEAHVKECFRCKEELSLLLEESAALSHGQIPAGDLAIDEQRIRQVGSAPKPVGPAEIGNWIPLRDRLAEYLRMMAAGWRLSFGQGAWRGEPDQGEEVWRWQSEDGNLRVSVTIEKNADLTFRFSSHEMDLEGVRLNFRLDRLSQEITLRPISESEVVAQVAVAWPYRQGNIGDISIEIV